MPFNFDRMVDQIADLIAERALEKRDAERDDQGQWSPVVHPQGSQAGHALPLSRLQEPLEGAALPIPLRRASQAAQGEGGGSDREGGKIGEPVGGCEPRHERYARVLTEGKEAAIAGDDVTRTALESRSQVLVIIKILADADSCLSATTSAGPMRSSNQSRASVPGRSRRTLRYPSARRTSSTIAGESTTSKFACEL